MIHSKRFGATWWPLYLLVLILIGLLFLVHYLVLSSGWRTFWEVGVVVFGYGLVGRWLETHTTALLDRPAIETHIAELALQDTLPQQQAQVRCQFYVAADPVITYGQPERAMFQ